MVSVISTPFVSYARLSCAQLYRFLFVPSYGV